MRSAGGNFILLQKISITMKKVLMLMALVLLVAFSSCKKERYCRCTTIIEDEAVNLGHDQDDYYLILDHSSCEEKSKEFSGWGHVTCVEITKEEATHNPEDKPWWQFWD